LNLILPLTLILRATEGGRPYKNILTLTLILTLNNNNHINVLMNGGVQ